MTRRSAQYIRASTQPQPQHFACNMDEQTLNREDEKCLEARLLNFFSTHAPHYKNRIPMIIDAYREWPLLLFGDLDHNYNTTESRMCEREAWEKEEREVKKVRVQVAQDYIYRAMRDNDYVHPREVCKFTQAKLGTSKVQKLKRNKVRTTPASTSAKIGARLDGVTKLGAKLYSLRKSVRAPRLRKSRLTAPVVVQVANYP